MFDLRDIPISVIRTFIMNTRYILQEVHNIHLFLAWWSVLMLKKEYIAEHKQSILNAICFYFLSLSLLFQMELILYDYNIWLAKFISWGWLYSSIYIHLLSIYITAYVILNCTTMNSSIRHIKCLSQVCFTNLNTIVLDSMKEKTLEKNQKKTVSFFRVRLISTLTTFSMFLDLMQSFSNMSCALCVVKL